MTQQRWTIAFAPLDEGMYEVTVRRTGSVHRFKTKLPPDISDLWTQEETSKEGTRQFRSGIETMTPDAQFFGAGNMPTLKEIGERIMDATLDVHNGREGIKVLGALEDRVASSGGIELQFDLSRTPELQGIPWEAAYLKSKDRFLAIGTTSNVVRRLDAQSDLPDPIERPIRILVAAANPHKDLDTEVELGNITRRVEELIVGGEADFEVEALHATTRAQFRTKVRDWKPHIIHYIGHSAFKDGSGYLYFESEGADDSSSDPVSAETIRNILQNWRPWVVVLNSCESGKTSLEHPMGGVAQDLLGRINIPFVVGMQKPVSDDAAIAFSQDFYAALTGGETIANAVTLGRNAISTQADVRTQMELITPALYTSGETDRIAFMDSVTAIAATAAAGTATASSSKGGKDFMGKTTKVLLGITGVLGAIAGLLVAVGEVGDSAGDLFGWGKEPTEEDASDKSPDDTPTDMAINPEGSSPNEPPPDGSQNAGTPAADDVDRNPPTRGSRTGPTPRIATQRSSTRAFVATRASNTVATSPTSTTTQHATGATYVPEDGPVGYTSSNYTATNTTAFRPLVSDVAQTQIAKAPALPQLGTTAAGPGASTGTASNISDRFTIPFCDGIRAEWRFKQNSTEIDPAVSQYSDAFDLSLITGIRDCDPLSIRFIGHTTAAEDELPPTRNEETGAFIALGSDRARSIAENYGFLADAFGSLPLGMKTSNFAASSPIEPREDGVSDPRNRRVQLEFQPRCPTENNIVARIEFAEGETGLTVDAQSQLQALAPAMKAAKDGTIDITGPAARSGDDIFVDGDARIRSVIDGLPELAADETPLMQPRMVGWSCPKLHKLEGDNLNDFVVVEIATPADPAETSGEAASSEADPYQ